MNKEGQELVAELNLTIHELTEKKDCIARQRDSVIDQATTLKNERNAFISKNIHKNANNIVYNIIDV